MDNRLGRTVEKRGVEKWKIGIKCGEESAHRGQTRNKLDKKASNVENCVDTALTTGKCRKKVQENDN